MTPDIQQDIIWKNKKLLAKMQPGSTVLTASKYATFLADNHVGIAQKDMDFAYKNFSNQLLERSERT
ncbi:MAG TPA: hypothetical protein VLH19_00125 [Patescibacteria group bacterium]|nr:hypothetical protein [Patescibacteria group bacterium]